MLVTWAHQDETGCQLKKCDMLVTWEHQEDWMLSLENARHCLQHTQELKLHMPPDKLQQ